MTDAEDRANVVQMVIDAAAVYATPEIAVKGVAQQMQATVLAPDGITTAGDVQVTVRASAMANSPKVISVAVAEEDSAYDVAEKIYIALTQDADVSGFFDITGVGVMVGLEASMPAANDGTMNIALAPGTSEGLTPAPTAQALQEGEAPDLSQVYRIVDACKLGQRWVASTTVVVGQRIYPATPNGLVYRVTRAGTFGSTDPFTGTADVVNDNGVTLEVIGTAGDSAYDVAGAIRKAWEAKLANASRFMSTGGMNMAVLFEHCQKMVNYYRPAMVG